MAASVDETQDVTAIDSLLNIKRVDPQVGSRVPLRIPSLWAEARLAVSEEQAQKSKPTPVQHSAPDTLPPRNMNDSYTEFTLPFASDINLLEEYVNASGGIRTGKLMEHLDSLAGSISYKHVLGPTASSVQNVAEMGLYIVTASVERLDMLRPLNATHDLRFSGQVIYTGKSSMEVAVRIESLAKDAGEKDETVLLGRFSMVCRDAKTNLAHPINALHVSTPEESTLFAIGQELKRRRASLAQRSLGRVPPSSEEAAALHENFLKFGEVIDQPNYIGYHHETNNEIRTVSSKKNSGLATLDYTAELVPMGETRVERCMLMFPQERNVHQKVFGGYLMRLAYELGFSNASMFCRGRVRFLALDEISFKLPVPIGSILRLTSVVLYDDLVKEPGVDGVESVHQLVVRLFFFRCYIYRGLGVEDLNLFRVLTFTLPLLPPPRLPLAFLSLTTCSRGPGVGLQNIGVRANVVDIETGTEKTTNEFRFTWQGEDKLNEDSDSTGTTATSSSTNVLGGQQQLLKIRKVRKVAPKTYREAMLWLGARRAVAVGDDIRELIRVKRDKKDDAGTS
ncbi:hypothetical protein D9757_003247 [Collybiopsis confluens]|uniref:HotDog ACOT-type domain-containing protein n=1 Tax=Collybiopsis confluens TaxID=2823264 RepID=A0A8H5HYX8_9AGAR|nr:hypothetical protein D9757_003247 [Collybiopsis confluens]